MSSCKLYILKPKNIELVKEKLLSVNEKGINYDEKELNGKKEKLMFYSRFASSEEKYEIYDVEIDLIDKYYTRGRGDTFYIYTIKLNIVLVNEKQSTYLIAYMNKSLIKIFENIISNLFEDNETLLQVKFDLNKVDNEFTDYKKFALDKLNHNNLDKIYVSGSNLQNSNIYKQYMNTESFIGKIFVLHNHIYGVEIYFNGSVYIRQNLNLKEQSKIVMEIYQILSGSKLTKVEEWNKSLLEF